MKVLSNFIRPNIHCNYWTFFNICIISDATSPPYLSPHYGNSPLYAPNPSISPNYLQQQQPIGQASPQYNFAPAQFLDLAALPPMNTWNIQASSAQQNQAAALPQQQDTQQTQQQQQQSSSMQMDCPSNLSSLLLNLDNQQLQPITLNSDELPAYSFDPNNLSEHLSNNLSLQDNAP